MAINMLNKSSSIYIISCRCLKNLYTAHTMWIWKVAMWRNKGAKTL